MFFSALTSSSLVPYAHAIYICKSLSFICIIISTHLFGVASKKHIARGCNLFYTGLDDDGCHLSSPLGKKYALTVSHPQIEKRKSSCHFFSQQLSQVMHFHFHHWSNFYLFPSPVLNFALSPL